MRIKTPVEPDHESGASFIHHIETGTHARRVEVDRLFTEDVLASARELFNLMRMQVSWGADYNGIDIIGGGDGIQIADFGV